MALKVLLATVVMAEASIVPARVNPACRTPVHWSGKKNVTIEVGGQERTFQLSTPWAARACPPGPHGFTCGVGPPNISAPLVIYWHGCNGHLPLLDYNLEISKVESVAADRGYFSISPVGTESGSSGEYGWNADGIKCGATGVDDFALFEALLAFARRELCVDMRRIYSIGFSTGAFLSYGIACRYPDAVAAVGIDAGSLSLEYFNACAKQPGAVPVQAFHSLADPTVPYDGIPFVWAGQTQMDGMWRRKNGCNGTETPRITHNSSTTTCRRWDCSLAPVETCALKAIEHCWYGGRSGGFASCMPRKGDVDATNHMFDLWEELAETSSVQHQEVEASG